MTAGAAPDPVAWPVLSASELSDVLVWEQALGLDRPRDAGLSALREQELLTALAQRSG
jgi:hypothetical protein